MFEDMAPNQIALQEIARKEAAEFTRDGPPIAVAQADAIAVSRNAEGDIVIRQRRPMASDDPRIVVPLQEAGILVEAIRREMKAAAE